MRIGVYLGNVIPPTEGGGNVFQNEIVKELISQNKDYEIIFYYFGNFINESKKANIKYVKLSNFLKFKNYLFSFKDLLFFLYFGFKKKYSFLNSILLKDKIDLVYFPTPSCFLETEIPFLFTMWDLGDKVHPYFPETSMQNREFELRNHKYSQILMKAMFVFIGNKTGKEQLMKYYSVGEDRIVINPMLTPKYIYSLQSDDSVLHEYGLEKNKYFFYPAQFWAHKNHIRLIYAMKDLVKRGYKLVFTGSDKGNLDYIKAKVTEYSLENSIIFTGFVSQKKIIGLYKNAFALIYASIMGPDNIPPLEAMGLGCPVICSKYDGSEEQLKDAVLSFDPYNTNEIIESVKILENNTLLRESLVSKGKILAKKYSIENYVKTVFDTIKKAESIRECWK